MDRLFLDANVLFSAAYRPGAGLLSLWQLPGCVLYTSPYAIAEARANLEDHNQRNRLDELCRALHLAEATSAELPAGILLPEEDVPILAAAIGVQATHLLTGDIRHFGRYLDKKVGGLIQLPGQYLKARQQP